MAGAPRGRGGFGADEHDRRVDPGADGFPWSLTPYGGQSDDEDLPEGWPRATGSFWFRRHDEFDDPPPSASGGTDPDDRR